MVAGDSSSGTDFPGFDEFLRTHGAALSRTAYLLTGDHQRAQDLLQSALVSTAVHWRRVSTGRNPLAYVRRVMVNRRTSWWRRHRDREQPTDAVPELAAARAEDDEAVSRVVLARALARLTARQRAVLVFRFYGDMTEADTAEALGCSIGTVKSQTRRALDRLRAIAPELAEFVNEATHRPDEVTV